MSGTKSTCLHILYFTPLPLVKISVNPHRHCYQTHLTHLVWKISALPARTVGKLCDNPEKCLTCRGTVWEAKWCVWGENGHNLSKEVDFGSVRLTLVSTFVLSRLDYCNSLLFGCSQYLLHKLQKVRNHAARLVLRVSKTDRISPHLAWACSLLFILFLCLFLSL